MLKTEFIVTREKHLDHMVKVVPFIVAAYAIQCYLIVRLGPIEFAMDGLFFLGACLVSMIFAFVTYDLTHVVSFQEETFSVSVNWLNYYKAFAYQDISLVEVSEAGQSFATLTVTTRSGKKSSFYFVDEPEKIKAWIEKKRIPEMQAAA